MLLEERAIDAQRRRLLLASLASANERELRPPAQELCRRDRTGEWVRKRLQLQFVRWPQDRVRGRMRGA